MSQKQLDQLSQKLYNLFDGTNREEAEASWASLIDEWQQNALIPDEATESLLEEVNPRALIESASGPLLDRLNWNRNSEMERAMRAKTVQEFSDALR